MLVEVRRSPLVSAGYPPDHLVWKDFPEGKDRTIVRVEVVDVVYYDSAPLTVVRMPSGALIASTYTHQVEKTYSIPEVPWDTVEKQWHSGYWDGPMNGAALLRGERVWFHTIEQKFFGTGADHTWIRVFGLYRLPDWLWAKLDERHAAFERHVGLHSNYPRGPQRPQSEHHKFYDVYKDKDDRVTALIESAEIKPFAFCEWA